MYVQFQWIQSVVELEELHIASVVKLVEGIILDQSKGPEALSSISPISQKRDSGMNVESIQGAEVTAPK